MTSERATIRPVTLGRLVEVTFLASKGTTSTEKIISELNVSRRRAREALLEAERIDLIEQCESNDNEQVYTATVVGTDFVTAVRSESWSTVSELLEQQSSHYDSFVGIVRDSSPVTPEDILTKLDEHAWETSYTYNQTSLDVLSDWAQRLGTVQRNAFTGVYYIATAESVPGSFPEQLITIADDLEETAGVNLQQRYLSIPELRERTCEQLACSRTAFNEALVALAQQNVGRIELSGAPIDTGAKDARYGIKTIGYTDDEEVVTTEQSSEQVMHGVELLGKQYYYLTIHDSELRFDNS